MNRERGAEVSGTEVHPTDRDGPGWSITGSFTLSGGQGRRVQRALRTTAEARVYRRLLVLWQLAQGQAVAEVAARTGVCRQSLYHGLTRYQQTADPAALQDRARPGRPSRWTPGALRVLRAALQRAPDRFGYRAVNCTVPLLIEHVARRSGVRVSDETMRRQVRRLGSVWKRPRYVLAADPDREKRRRIVRRLAHLGPRAVVLAEDETDVLLFPPLRAAWARRGQSSPVGLTGWNARRVVFGALNVRTGARVFLARERQRRADYQVFLHQLRQRYPGRHRFRPWEGLTTAPGFSWSAPRSLPVG